MLVGVVLIGRHEPIVDEGGETAQCHSQFHMLAGDDIYKKNPLDGLRFEVSGPSVTQYALAEKCQSRRVLYGFALQALVIVGLVLVLPAITTIGGAIVQLIRRTDS
jgi:hypothetical protein